MINGVMDLLESPAPTRIGGTALLESPTPTRIRTPGSVSVSPCCQIAEQQVLGVSHGAVPGAKDIPGGPKDLTHPCLCCPVSEQQKPRPKGLANPWVLRVP